MPPRGVIDKLIHASEHPDAFTFAAVAVVLFIVAAIGQRREWGGIFLTVLFLGAIGSICTAGVMALLGAEARKGPVVILGGSKADGVACSRDMECLSAKCRKVSGQKICVVR